ncbi:TPA: hypothetical protein ACH3X3_002869 [Trebouxia sp. C0006]
MLCIQEKFWLIQRSIAHQQQLSRRAVYPVAKVTQTRFRGTSLLKIPAGYWTRQRSCSLRQARSHGDHASSERGTTPLHLAARQGNIETAKSRLSSGADINAQEVQEEALNSWGWTPLHYAAWHNKIQMVKLLLSHGASIDAKDSEGATPLALAACTNCIALTELLLSRGATPAPFIQGNLAVRDNNKGLHPLDQCVRQDWTPLHYVVRHNRSKMALVLIAHGASPDDTLLVDSDSPLQVAIRAGNLHMVKLLWEHMSNQKHERQPTEYVYLATAVSENQTDIVEHLLSIGVDAAEKSWDGWSHILSAVADPILGLLDMQLLSLEQPKYDDAHARLTTTDYGDDSAPDSDSDNDSNSVDIASFYSLPQERVAVETAKRLRMMQMLLLHGADVHACPSRRKGTGPSRLELSYQYCPGQTALHLAVQHRSPVIVQLLLTHGADPEARTPEGHTPLHHAAFTNDLETIKLLLHHGVNASATDYQDALAAGADSNALSCYDGY